MARWVNFKTETEWCVWYIVNITAKLLKNRKQRVVLNGSSADFSTICSTTRFCASLLYLIYVNSIEKNIICNIFFFADGTMLLSTVKHPVISANDLNNDSKVIHECAYQWKLEFNPDPSKQATELLFFCKKSCPNHLFFNGIR